jgi:hypothetical protein
MNCGDRTTGMIPKAVRCHDGVDVVGEATQKADKADKERSRKRHGQSDG